MNTEQEKTKQPPTIVSEAAQEKKLPNIPEAAQEIPAVFSNGFSMAATQTSVRIAFGESFGDREKMKYRIAVSMGYPEAKMLINTLTSLLNQLEEKQQEK